MYTGRTSTGEILTAFVHRYSMNRKRWLVTFDNDKKSVEGKGKWLDLKKLERIEKVKDYDEDQHSESPMDEGVVVPEGYTDYSCKYCKLSVIDSTENFLPMSILTCSGCNKFVHGDTCCDPPITSKIMSKYYANPDVLEDAYKEFYCDECRRCDSCNEQDALYGIKAVNRREFQCTKGKQNEEPLMLCHRCELLYKDNQYCRICEKTYDKNNFLLRLEKADRDNAEGGRGRQRRAPTVPKGGSSVSGGNNKSGNAPTSKAPKWGSDELSMLKCQGCKSFVHAACCNVSLADFHLMKEGKHPSLNESFLCMICAGERSLAIVNELRKFDTLALFHEPVTDAIAPNYRDMISKPMDLQTMESRAKSQTDFDYNWTRVSFLRLLSFRRTHFFHLGCRVPPPYSTALRRTSGHPKTTLTNPNLLLRTSKGMF